MKESRSSKGLSIAKPPLNPNPSNDILYDTNNQSRKRYDIIPVIELMKVIPEKKKTCVNRDI